MISRIFKVEVSVTKTFIISDITKLNLTLFSNNVTYLLLLAVCKMSPINWTLLLEIMYCARNAQIIH